MDPFGLTRTLHFTTSVSLFLYYYLLMTNKCWILLLIHYTEQNTQVVSVCLGTSISLAAAIDIRQCKRRPVENYIHIYDLCHILFVLSVQVRRANRPQDHPKRREVPRFSEAGDQRSRDN